MLNTTTNVTCDINCSTLRFAKFAIPHLELITSNEKNLKNCLDMIKFPLL